MFKVCLLKLWEGGLAYVSVRVKEASVKLGGDTALVFFIFPLSNLSY